MKFSTICKLIFSTFVSVNLWSMDNLESYKIIKAEDLSPCSQIYLCHRSNFFPWPLMKIGGVKIEYCSLDESKENVSRFHFGKELEIPYRGTLHWALPGTIPSQSYKVSGKDLPILDSAFPYLIFEKNIDIYSGHPNDFYSIGDHIPSKDSIIFIPQEELNRKNEILKLFPGKIIGYNPSTHTTLDISIQHAKDNHVPSIKGTYVAINADHFKYGLLDSTKLPLLFMLERGQFSSDKLITFKLIDYSDNIVGNIYFIKEDEHNTLLFPTEAFDGLATQAGKNKKDWVIYYHLPTNQFISAKEFTKWADIELIAENYDHRQSIPYKIELLLAEKKDGQFKIEGDLKDLFNELESHFSAKEKDKSAFVEWLIRVKKHSY